MAILCTTYVPALAAGDQPANSTLQMSAIVIADEPITLYFDISKGNRLTYAEIGDDILRVVGNKVFVNDELVATITSEVVDGDPSIPEPYTGWIYSDSCPLGFNSSDFSTYFKSVNHNITFKKALSEMSMATILVILCTIVPFAKEVAAEAVFRNVAATIATMTAAYMHDDKVYAVETVYQHKSGMGYMHKNNFVFYSDSAHTKEIDRTTAYSSWA